METSRALVITNILLAVLIALIAAILAILVKIKVDTDVIARLAGNIYLAVYKL